MNKVLNSKTKKVAVLCLAGALVTTTCVGIDLYKSRDNSAYAAQKTQKAVEKEYPQITPSVSGGDGKMQKDETVYVIKDANGVQKNVYVAEWLRNGQKSKKIKDESNLEKIKNTAGDETYSKSGNNLTWNANGDDIRYQGTTNADLPVSVNVSYFLNGKRMTADQIAGKSGNVEIKFKYDVHKVDVVNVNGEQYSLNHPYTMASGVMLDNAHFTDVKVSSGKSVNDGNNTVCLGVAFPGMKQNLNLKNNKLDIPEEVTIKAKTDDFEIDGTYTAALDGVLSDLNLSSITGGSMGKLDELTSGLTQLSNASNQLVNGTDKLRGGANKLLAGSQSLQSGAASLASGANSLASGTGRLASGSSQLNSGIVSLYQGLGQLSANSQALRKATYTLENQVFKTAGSQINKALKEQNITMEVNLTPSNYVQQLTGISGKATGAAETQIREALTRAGVSGKSTQNTIMSLAYNQMMTSKNAGKTLSVTEAVTKAGALAKEAQVVQAATSNGEIVNQAVAQIGVTNSSKEKVAAAATAIYLQKQGMSESEAAAKAAEYVQAAALYQDAETNASSNSTALINYAAASSDAVKNASSQLKTVRTSLDSVVAYVKAVETYTAGVDSAYAGSKKLLAGSSQLMSGAQQVNSGAAQLASGAEKLNKGSQSLVSGIGSLASGANTLSSGMNKFNSEGIQKLTGALNENELKDMTNRLEAIVQASKRSNMIGGMADNMTGESRMIFKTMEIKK